MAVEYALILDFRSVAFITPRGKKDTTLKNLSCIIFSMILIGIFCATCTIPGYPYFCFFSAQN